MSDWDGFTKQLLDALRRFVQGDARPYKSQWSHRDDVTIFGGWGAYEQGWATVEPRLDWAASRGVQIPDPPPRSSARLSGRRRAILLFASAFP